MKGRLCALVENCLAVTYDYQAPTSPIIPKVESNILSSWDLLSSSLEYCRSSTSLKMYLLKYVMEQSTFTICNHSSLYSKKSKYRTERKWKWLYVFCKCKFSGMSRDQRPGYFSRNYYVMNRYFGKSVAI